MSYGSTTFPPGQNNDKYFATLEAEKTTGILMNKAESFYNGLRANSYLDKLVMMYRAYYGSYGDSSSGTGHQVNFVGEQGELVHFPVNHFRNLAQHMFNMITANRPVMEARAVNDDYKSLAQTYLANGILDYYMREKRLENCLKKAAEMAIVLGSGFVKLDWNATAGETYDFDDETQQFSYEGEIEFSNLSPFDVVVDGTKESWNNDWILVRSFQNRFNLIAKYPELAEKIKAVPTKSESSTYRMAVFSNDETDDIAVFEFFHRRTEAIPDGRYLLFVDSNTVLLDAKLPYRTMPIFRITAGEIMGTPYGYSPMFDVFPIQEMINSTYSAIATNQNAFAVQNVWVPHGADINISTIEGAMNVVSGNAKPEPLNLAQTPKEVFEFLNMLIQAAETISGVNSVARGNPEANLKSGNALALVQSMALQFISGLQQSYVKMIEDVGTSLIQILKDFAMTPKTVALIGKNNKPLLKEFTGESISAINRVIVDVGNPLARCLKKGTQVRMFDGSTKKVEDIVIGDYVMGPDSKKRTVSCINSGDEMMYDIHQHKKSGDGKFIYGCNESHILTLRYCSDDGRYGLKQYQEVDMSVKEYLSLPKRHRRLFMGFRTGVDYPKQELPIPPYIMGLWLGDGHSRTTCLTSMDNELAGAWEDYALSLGLKVRVEDQENNLSKMYHITSGESHGASDRNPFMTSLRALDLINNKHIPAKYMVSSREDRLALLAGYLDTDGSLTDGTTFVIGQSKEHLSNQIVDLARSLGFKATLSKHKADSGPTRDGSPRQLTGISYRVTIGGNTWTIPTLLPRKQAPKREKHRNWQNYGIDVRSAGVGTYYGFTLAEEPHFLLGDFTVTHNTVAGRVQMAEQLLQMKLIQSPEQYFQVINTGRLDSLYHGEMSELLLVQSENESLLEGRPIKATAIDKHKLHIEEHRSVIAGPELRNDPVLVQNTLAHIQDHINLLRSTDPDLLMLIGEHPLQQQPPPGMPPGPNGPPQGGPPQGGPGGPPPQQRPFPSMLPNGGQGAPPPHQQHAAQHPHPPVHALQRSPMDKIMGSDQGQIAPGSKIVSQELGNMTLPQIPRPPKPFQHLPTQAGEIPPK